MSLLVCSPKHRDWGGCITLGVNSGEATIHVSGLPVFLKQGVMLRDTWLFRTRGDSLGLLPRQPWKIWARRCLGGLWGLQLGDDLLLNFLQHLLVLGVILLHAGEDSVELGQPCAQAFTLHQLGLDVAVQVHIFPVNGGLQVLGTGLQGHDLQKVLGGKETICACRQKSGGLQSPTHSGRDAKEDAKEERWY